MLELRRFQEEALEALRGYLDALTEQAEEQSRYNRFLKTQNRPPRHNDSLARAWAAATGKSEADWKTRRDGVGRPIPHVCLKIPTGGGKTLVAAHAVRLINHYYFRRNTGLVLWIVPSEAIYRQTLKNFKNYDHPYREVLDMAAPRRRALILERQRLFVPADVERDFVVMLLMLQASSRETKAQLRMFRDHGGYIDFFPSPGDYPKHHQIYREIPNLDVHRHEDIPHAGGFEPLTIKYSLGNVLRRTRPIIVIDEGHKAYSDKAREAIDGFNPRFILELSATPKPERSNLLVDISGAALKEEQMIKLPIRLKNVSTSDWQTTLGDACERLKELDAKAKRYRSEHGRYIRPILLARVERTGSDQRGRGLLHAEDVREYLTEQIGFRPDEVRVKGGGKNEIANTDLMSPFSPVRIVITKAALQEGWDCPFAYVLALLDRGTSSTALTQMIGRVLRQPYAQATGIDDLDMAHVFCFDQDVGRAIEQIRMGLQSEGLGDVADRVLSDVGQEDRLQLIPRRDRFRDLDVVLPHVLCREDDSYRPLSYERDILSTINWGDIRHMQPELLVERDQAITEGLIDLDDARDVTTQREASEGEVTAAFFARHLSDILPNPWQAMRIAKEVMPSLLAQGSKQDIYNNRMNTVRQMRHDIAAQKEQLAKRVFENKLRAGEIIFDLNATQSGWKIPKDLRMKSIGKPRYLTRETNEQIVRSLFDKYEERNFNQFERKVAGYLDEAQAIEWWHRVAARQEYGLQGWRKHLIYPDFVAFSSNDGKQYLILETKGGHLVGNDDTKYKEALFEALERTSGRDIGSVKIAACEGGEIIPLVIFEWDGRERLAEAGIHRH